MEDSTTKSSAGYEQPAAPTASPAAAETSIASRIRGMILGNLVGDAAAVPNHWVYDPVKMSSHVQAAKRGPAFCDPPGNGFYTTKPGAQSCYGDQTIALLESLVENKGFNAADYASRVAERFGRNSAYELDATDPEDWPELKKNPKDDQGNVIEDKRLWTMPLPGPWRHGSIKTFLVNFVTKDLGPTSSGSPDSQIDACCKVPPLVALYAGSPALLPTVEEAVRITQNTDLAVAFACCFARILESLVLGSAASVQEACDHARAAISSSSKQFVTAKDDEAVAALSLVAECVSTPASAIGEKVREAMDLPSAMSALA